MLGSGVLQETHVAVPAPVDTKLERGATTQLGLRDGWVQNAWLNTRPWGHLVQSEPRASQSQERRTTAPSHGRRGLHLLVQPQGARRVLSISETHRAPGGEDTQDCENRNRKRMLMVLMDVEGLYGSYSIRKQAPLIFHDSMSGSGSIHSRRNQKSTLQVRKLNDYFSKTRF